MISRRSFMALASGLLVPEIEPVRAYSFVGGWRGAPVGELRWDNVWFRDVYDWAEPIVLPARVGTLTIVHRAGDEIVGSRMAGLVGGFPRIRLRTKDPTLTV